MAALTEDTGSGDRLFSINGAKYMVDASNTGSTSQIPGDISLVTVLQLPDGPKPKITEQWVRDCVQMYKSADDVFHERFMEGVILPCSEDDVEIEDGAHDAMKEMGTTWVKYVAKDSDDPKWGNLHPGPHVLLGGHLRDPWRLFSDTNGTLMTTFRPQKGPSEHTPFEQLHVKHDDGNLLSVALPSRIKFRTSTASSLAGMRIVIKDNLNLKGVKTSMCNRAFYDTYPPQAETAESIQKLIDLGAIILGKAKLNSFAIWEEPTEYIDYQAPWNPRADGYQSPGGSSTGSASAVAAYDWLDIAIGTDTWGSVVRPALWCGCFGLRPSIGAVSSKGLVPCVDTWDIPGFLGRDLEMCRRFAAEWLDLEALSKESKPFTSILWPIDYWKIIGDEQVKIAEEFVKDMETYLGVDHSRVSFEAEWDKAPPADANGRSLADYINPATSNMAYDAYHSNDDFREKYKAKFHSAPYVSPPNQHAWEAGKNISKTERDEGMRRIDVYLRWFKSTVLGNGSNALIVLPVEGMEPRYRDEPPTFKRPPQDGIHSLALAAVLQAPSLSVPLGGISYSSKVTHLTEQLPVGVALTSPAGTDLVLMETTQKIMESSKRKVRVATGKYMFS